ncbi:MAG: FAD-binding protein [Coriobacteriales bacterium]|jgi:fumarate reductase flavoprotein subunit
MSGMESAAGEHRVESGVTRRDFTAGVIAAGVMATATSGMARASEVGQSGRGDASGYKAGTYECETMGMGRVRVMMTCSSSAITDVMIDASNETPALGGVAADTLRQEVLDAQSAAVDTVTGATMTTNAVREAVENCIEQARGVADELPKDDLISPIPALEPPAAWDREADVVILGASLGGLVAAARIAESGRSVIVVEKENDCGGSSRITTCIQFYGGNEKLFGDETTGVFGTPYHDIDVADYYMERFRWTPDYQLIRHITVSLREVSNWLTDRGAALQRMGGDTWWFYWNGEASGCDNCSSGASTTRHLVDFEHQLATDAGAEILFETTGKNLVMDGDTCVGIAAVDDQGKTIFIHGKEAVVLAGDNIGRNHKMIEKYCPTANAARGACNKANGYTIRMGLGAGADMSGIGSWGGNDSHIIRDMPDPETDLMPISTPWDYMAAVALMPLFRVDKNCERIPLVTNEKINKVLGWFGDTSEPVHFQAAQVMSRGGSYIVMDANWRDALKKLDVSNNDLYSQNTSDSASSDMGGHRLSQTGSSDVDSWHLPPEWGTLDPEASFAESLANGGIKQADTLEELAEMLGLDPDKLVKAVDDWNEIVASGKNDEENNYSAAWMSSIVDGPFYGIACSPSPYAIYAGLRVTPKSEVVDTQGDVIPHLYAACHTAGGIAGTSQVGRCCMGDQIGAMTASGWNISKAILGEEWTEI